MKEYQFAYGHGSVTVPLEERSVLAVLHGNDAPAMQDIRAGLLESLAHPIGSKPLCEEIPVGASVALVVSDMSRFWMRQDLVVPHLVEYLHTACGIDYGKLTIVVANGTHTGGDEQELRTLVTDGVFDKVRVENHDCEAKDLVYLGTTAHDTPVWLNKTVATADFVVCLGACTHHIMAGFGGAFMSMSYAQGWSLDMVAGRGFIALAAQAMGSGECLGGMLSSLVFGFAQALGIKFSARGLDSNLASPIPYAVTIIGLVVFSLIRRSHIKKQHAATQL